MTSVRGARKPGAGPRRCLPTGRVVPRKRTTGRQAILPGYVRTPMITSASSPGEEGRSRDPGESRRGRREAMAPRLTVAPSPVLATPRGSPARRGRSPRDTGEHEHRLGGSRLPICGGRDPSSGRCNSLLRVHERISLDRAGAQGLPPAPCRPAADHRSMRRTVSGGSASWAGPRLPGAALQAWARAVSNRVVRLPGSRGQPPGARPAPTTPDPWLRALRGQRRPAVPDSRRAPPPASRQPPGLLAREDPLRPGRGDRRPHPGAVAPWTRLPTP